jgi:hypothetical protein
MIWLILLLALVLIASGLMLTPIVLNIDTRVPEIKFAWKGIGNAAINYKDEEWLLRFSILFYNKEIQLRSAKGRKKKQEKTKRKKRNLQKMIQKFLAVGKTFQVPVWKISLDTEDYVYNAWLYPLNYFIGLDHWNINFHDENYLVLELRNNLGRMLYAWFR